MDIFTFYDAFINYKPYNCFNRLDTMADDAHIVDRCSDSNMPVDPKLIRIMKFDHTSYNNDNGQVRIVSILFFV